MVLLGKYVDETKRTIAIVGFFVQAFIIFCITMFVMVNQHKLDLPFTRGKIGLIYTGINLNRNHATKYYTTMYLIR